MEKYRAIKIFVDFLSDHIHSFIVTYFYTRNKFEKRKRWKKTKNSILGESDDEDASIVLEFIFSKQMKINAHLYEVVENFTDYSNI